MPVMGNCLYCLYKDVDFDDHMIRNKQFGLASVG
jgi:hypothetical protein